MEIRLEQSDELEQEIEDIGLDLMDYDKRGSRYRIKMAKKDIKKHREFIANLIRKAKGIKPLKDDDEKNT